MKLADILATKQKTIRCPACGKKLWLGRSLTISTGRCPHCATRIIEDLPPLPEVALVKPEDLVARWKWKDIATLLFLVGFTLINLSCFTTKTEDGTAFLDILVLVLGFLPVIAIGWIWQKHLATQRLKCPSCGNPLHAPLVLETGRCNRCGIGLQPAPPLKGQPIMTLAEYFRRKSRHSRWSWILFMATILAIVIPWLIPLGGGYKLVLAITGVAYVLLMANITLLAEYRVVCPDCRKRRFVPVPLFFLQRCGKCGRHLVDLDAGGGVAAYRRFRRQLWWQWGIMNFGAAAFLLLLWAGPFDCPPVDDADLKPPTRLEVAPADNAWTYFVPAWQAVAEMHEISWELISGTTWDEVKADEFLKSYQPALESLEKGLACQVCQPPALGGFLATQRPKLRLEQKSRRLVDLLSLRCEWERRHGQLDAAIAMALKMNHYGMFLQSHAEDEIQLTHGRSASYQSLALLRRLAKEPGISVESLVLAERKLAPCTASAFWSSTLAGMLKREYALSRELLQGIAKDPRYRDGDSLFFGDIAYLFKFNFWYQPNRSQQALALACRQWLANLDQPLAKMPGLTTCPTDLLLGIPVFSSNWIGKFASEYQISGMRISLFSNRNLRGNIALTRALLLCLAYEKKHGQLPETLQALVPEFVEAVPLDPFDSKPIRYSKERQIVYCVGADGKDDGGPKNEKGWGRPDDYSRLDQVLELKPKAKE
jgi:ribosomal protein L37AE/L43A